MLRTLVIFLIATTFLSCGGGSEAETPSHGFQKDRDLLLVHYDNKTDVDDLHSVAAFATILENEAWQDLNYHAVAGTYGTQEGPYVPPNPLFELAFGEQWSDAHAAWGEAVETVADLAVSTLQDGGDVWIAEGGQSDFSADVLDRVRGALPDIETRSRFHVVQHSDWNEQVTTPVRLEEVKRFADYQKIADGNGSGNGTPNYNGPVSPGWQDGLSEHLSRVWAEALERGQRYNGADGRYLNQSIARGGLDFSDTAEVWHILGLEGAMDRDTFFQRFAPVN